MNLNNSFVLLLKKWWWGGGGMSCGQEVAKIFNIYLSYNIIKNAKFIVAKNLEQIKK
jgi:hypothetical protein